jgi:nitrite reductase/ring-hydroxylating ferredoxin subunit/uncharacterized membrane protein
MASTDALTRIADLPVLQQLADPLSQAVKGAYEAGGAAGQQAKDALHGVWLGHPLHPVFTDLPVGAWTTALALDVAGRNDPEMRRAATFAMGVGLLGAVGAAVTGLTDWSETSGRSQRAGLLHGLLNVTATSLFAAAYAFRKQDSHDGGRKCAWTGYAIALASAYIGGDLVYGQRIGVTHAAVDQPETFTPVAASAEVPEGTMKRARKDDVDALVVRQHGRVCALAHPCAHMGGPLSEGTLKDGSVVCPWHGSEFALEDGSVIHGPATQRQPAYDVREQDGSIAIQVRE